MEMRFFLKSIKPSGEGVVDLRFAPVEGAKENEEFIDTPSAEIVLDQVKAEACEGFSVPTTDQVAGFIRDKVTGHVIGNVDKIKYQEFIVTIEKA